MNSSIHFTMEDNSAELELAGGSSNNASKVSNAFGLKSVDRPGPITSSQIDSSAMAHQGSEH